MHMGYSGLKPLRIVFLKIIVIRSLGNICNKKKYNAT